MAALNLLQASQEPPWGIVTRTLWSLAALHRAVFIAIVLLPVTLGSVGCGCDLEIKTRTLPDGTIGSLYTFELDSHCGGDEWLLESGTLPPGISLLDDGTLRGVPSQAGTFNFTIGLFDFDGDRTFKGFSLTVLESS